MANNLVLRYPLDPTGVSPDNRIQNEEHTLTTAKFRPIATTYGAFYKDSMVIVDLATGLPLNSNQYRCVEVYELPSARYGREITAIVLITDPGVSNEVSLTYQCLGGEYSRSATAIVSQIEALKLDSRPVAWPDVIGIPDAFTPAKHKHDAGDIYGFEYVVNALDRIRAAIELGDAASHDAILFYIDKIAADLNKAVYDLNLKTDNHIGNRLNPHNTTAAQVGAYTIAQVNALINNLQQLINTHASDVGNPHNTTAGQVGAYTKAETDSLLLALQSSLGDALAAHLADFGNPHNTTAGQVGAYTKAETDNLLAGASDALTNQLIAHITNTSNPHNTTAAQVGAYTIAQVNALLNDYGDKRLRNTWEVEQVFKKGFNLPVTLASSGTGWFMEGGMLGSTPALRIRYNANTVMTFALNKAVSLNCGQLLNSDDIAAFDDALDTTALFTMN